MNDLKTLYNARSNKDELAEVAEKLGIEDKSLSGILKEIAGGMINVPVITEADLSGPVPIARLNEILASAIVQFQGGLYCLCTNFTVITDAVESFTDGAGYLYVRKFSAAAGAIDELEGLVLYYGDDDSVHIAQYSV